MIINGKNFYDQPVYSDIKRYEESRKSTAGQDEDYTTGCLLDYDYIKNHFRVVTVDLCRQKELDADPKAIQQIEFVGQSKKLDADDSATDAGDGQSMFGLINFRKHQRNKIKIFSMKCNSITKNDKLSRNKSKTNKYTN